jgi:hypothetical protein
MSDILKDALYTEEQVLEGLKAGICYVKFTKVSGEVSEMQATLNERWLPEVPPKAEGEETKPAKPKKEPPKGLMSMYSVDRQGWRSTYLDKILEFRLVEPA